MAKPYRRVGNGQYYDPETGRFLTRGVNPDSTNPYIPFDPTSFLLAPLGLMAVYYGSRRSKKYAPYTLLLVFMVILPVSIGLACGTPAATPAPAASPSPTVSPPEVSPTGATITPGPLTAPPVIPSGTATVTQTPTAPAPCCNWLPDKIKFTRYVTVRENDSFFTPNDPTWSNAVHIEKTPGGKETTLTPVPVWRFYVGNAENDPNKEGYTELMPDCLLDTCVRWSVYQQGSGLLTEPGSLSLSNNQKYVKVDTNNKPPGYNAAYYFTNQLTGSCNTALKTDENIIAVAGNLFGSEGHRCGDTYYFNIPELENIHCPGFGDV